MQAPSSSYPVSASILMVAAMAILGVIDNVVVLLAETIGLWQFQLTRTLMMLPLIGGMSLIGLGGLRPQRLGAVILRSVLVATALMFYFSALAVMPIAQALAGLFTSPMFVLLISSLGMGQRIGIWRILAVVVGFAGILCVLQPDPQDFDFKVLLPVAGGFFYALGAVTTRHMCAGESTVVLLGALVIALGLAGSAGLIGLAAFPSETVSGPAGFVTRGWVWPMSEAIPWVMVQAVGSSLAVFMLIKAYQLGEPSYVSVFEYSVMIFGPLFAWAALGQPVGMMQIAGIALIATAGSVIALRSG
ncbi:DMT family transporter [Ruegeria sp. HKCCD8929]|uniref:DMT family transporter n=1 Tax=Ruegeria sp. HKCCD8929 TaxID=2683006 RepID=UPI001489BC31|nr:DMT family transporter [Ruegeria sp. HKCCD8929]